MQAELWSLSRLAVELGRDRRALAKALKDLPPDLVEKSGRGLDRRWRLKAAVEHIYRGNAPAGNVDDQRQRLAAAQAEKVERENLVRAGELLEFEAVELTWADLVTAFRAKMLSMPTKLGPQLINITSPAIVAARLTVEIHAALHELARGSQESNGQGSRRAASSHDERTR